MAQRVNDHGGDVLAEGRVLEFDGIGFEQCDAVNRQLGIDPKTGAGDWPAGLTFHAGGANQADGWSGWESNAAQQEFMNSRLGRALQEGGVTDPPSRVAWLDLAAATTLAG